MMTIEEAIVGRRSIRAFRKDPVPRDLVERILKIASRAPSGSNIQPWHVYVLAGADKDALVQDLMHAHENSIPGQHEYQYDPNPWFEPYQSRRRKVGWDLYGALGIVRGDTERIMHQVGRNYAFFDAPVGMIFTIESKLPVGCWLDYGMFMQNIMIAARGFGLDTCAQQAFSRFSKIIRNHIPCPADHTIMCGMALGYAEANAPENCFQTERRSLEDIATFKGFAATGKCNADSVES